MFVFAGLRIQFHSGQVLLDESPPAEELDQIQAIIARERPPEMVGYHKLRARTAGRRQYADLHVQFRDGTTLERAHQLAHKLRDAIARELPQVEVLIHVEPEASRKDPRESGPFRAG